MKSAENCKAVLCYGSAYGETTKNPFVELEEEVWLEGIVWKDPVADWKLQGPTENGLTRTVLQTL